VWAVVGAQHVSEAVPSLLRVAPGSVSICVRLCVRRAGPGGGVSRVMGNSQVASLCGVGFSTDRVQQQVSPVSGLQGTYHSACP
jgi:hypothetical protein